MKKIVAICKSCRLFSFVKRISFLVATIFFAELFFGCKSTQVKEQEQLPADKTPLTKIHPFAILGDDFSIYVHIPVQKHIELTSSIISSEVEGLSYANAKLISSRIKNLYLGVSNVSDRSLIEASAEGSIPQSGIKKTFTEKNGWKENKYNAKSNKSFVYYSANNSDADVSFLTNSLFCFANDIKPMLQKYSESPEVQSSHCSEWILQGGDDINFYIKRPGQFLRNLIGQLVTIGSDYIYGTLSYVPSKKNVNEYSETYSLMFRMHLTDKRAMTAVRSLLSLSFGMTDAKIKQIDEYTVELSGLEVTQSQIESMIVRDSIKGKHYKVIDGNVIEESK